MNNNNLMKAKDGYSLQGDSTEQSPILDGRLSRYSSVFDESDEAAWDMCFVVRLDGKTRDSASFFSPFGPRAFYLVLYNGGAS
jgi:hypothetical protein